MQFFLIYIKEAHAIDSSRPSTFAGKDGVPIEDPVDLAERQRVCAACIEDLNLPMPALVDKLDDAVNTSYGGWPDRLYLVGKDGKIAYAGGRGPGGFRPDELEDAILDELTAIRKRAGKRAKGVIR